MTHIYLSIHLELFTFSTSPENRLTIRPSGVVSKNEMGALNTAAIACRKKGTTRFSLRQFWPSHDIATAKYCVVYIAITGGRWETLHCAIPWAMPEWGEVPKQRVGAQRIVVNRAQTPRNKTIFCFGQAPVHCAIRQRSSRRVEEGDRSLAHSGDGLSQGGQRASG